MDFVLSAAEGVGWGVKAVTSSPVSIGRAIGMLAKPEVLMAPNMFFPSDPEFNDQFLRCLGMACQGGADLKECLIIAAKITSGDASSWHAAFHEAAVRIHKVGDEALAAGCTSAAKTALLRSMNYYRSSNFFLRDDFADARVIQSVKLSEECWDKVAPLLGVKKVHIPFKGDGYTLNGGAMPAVVASATKPPDGFTKSPVVVCAAGYDGSSGEMYLIVKTFLDAGFHVIAASDPGHDAEAILEPGTNFRPDGETTIGSIIDWAIGAGGFAYCDGVVVYGASFAGYTATRAMLHEHRPHLYVLDACNPSMRDALFAKFPGPLRAAYLPEWEKMNEAGVASGGFQDPSPIKPWAEQSMMVKTLMNVVLAKKGLTIASKANMHGIKVKQADGSYSPEMTDKYFRDISRYHTKYPADYVAKAKVPCIMVDPEHEPIATGPIGADGKPMRFGVTMAPHMPEGSVLIHGEGPEGMDGHCCGGARLLFGEKVVPAMLVILKKQLAIKPKP